MSRLVSRWAPPLRIARRLARQEKGRSALVSALVAVPVLGGTLASVLYATITLSPVQEFGREYGRADLLATVTTAERLASDATAYDDAPRGVKRRDPAKVDLAALLPKGSNITPAPFDGQLSVDRDGARVEVSATDLDLASPLAAGIVRLDEGTLPGKVGEVAISPATAARFDLGLGDGLRTADGRTERVTALVIDPSCLRCEALVGRLPDLRSTAAKSGEGDGLTSSYTWLVDLPRGADVDAVRRDLARAGVLGETPTRSRFTALPTQGGFTAPTLTTSAVFLFLGLGALQVLLLAGTAFAVGTRRQVRALGLIGANGGRPGDLRRVVLGQGLLLSAVGAAVAVPIGIAAVPLGRPLWERVNNTALGPFDLPVWQILGVLLLALLAGVLAALLPAITAARIPTLAALAARVPTRSVRGRWQALATAVALFGFAGAGLATWRWAAFNKATESAAIAAKESFTNTPEGGVAFFPQTPTSNWPYVILGCLTVATAAILVLLPSLLGYLSHLGGRLPLVPRMALRDAGRHRHRVAPATAGVMAAVTGAVALSFYFAGADAHDRANYVGSLRPNQVTVQLYQDDRVTTNRSVIDKTAAELSELLGTASILVERPEPLTDAEGIGAGLTGRTLDSAYPKVAIGSPSLLSALGESPPAAASAALGRGEAVVTNPALVQQDRWTIYTCCPGSGAKRPTKLASLPAYLWSTPTFASLPDVLISSDTAKRLGLQIRPDRLMFSPSSAPSAKQIDALTAAANRRASAVVSVEQGYTGSAGALVMTLLIVALLVAVLGVGISIALSAAESKQDLLTLASLGADGRRRRLLAVCQALIVGGLGGVLGVGLGAVIGAMVLTGARFPVAVPVGTVGLLLLGAPVLGMLIAAVFTPARLPAWSRQPD